MRRSTPRSDSIIPTISSSLEMKGGRHCNRIGGEAQQQSRLDAALEDRWAAKLAPRRPNPGARAGDLSDRDLRDLAAYYSSLPW